MMRKSKLVVAIVWALSLAGVGVASQVFAQTTAQQAGREPEVIVGPDFGFRVDHYRAGTPVGEVVVKRDGKWIPVQFMMMLKR